MLGVIRVIRLLGRVSRPTHCSCSCGDVDGVRRRLMTCSCSEKSRGAGAGADDAPARRGRLEWPGRPCACGVSGQRARGIVARLGGPVGVAAGVQYGAQRPWSSHTCASPKAHASASWPVAAPPGRPAWPRPGRIAAHSLRSCAVSLEENLTPRTRRIKAPLACPSCGFFVNVAILRTPPAASLPPPLPATLAPAFPVRCCQAHRPPRAQRRPPRT